jgi:hypothetical protein
MEKRVNGWAKWVAIFVVIALAVCGWIWNAATVYNRVERVCGENAKDHPMIQQNREDILKIQGKLDSIESGVDRIEKKLDR